MPVKKTTPNKGNGKSREVYIVSVARTAVGRALKGTLKEVRPEDMAAAVIKGAI
ncbi:MAG: hypothetical protein FJ088_12920, partial [Deltaproteobacteria bacterium]|nr:hypothetical protein [Deltaproteobacteria bacterium]